MRVPEMANPVAAPRRALISRKSAPPLGLSKRIPIKMRMKKPESGLPQSPKTIDRKFVKRKHAQEGRAAASGATRRGKENAGSCAARQDTCEAPATAASGAGPRNKIRMKGLFGKRHWILHEHKDAFSAQMMEIATRFQGKDRSTIKKYKETMQESLGDCFHGGNMRSSTGSYLSSRAISPIRPASPAAASHTRGDQSMGAASSAILSPASGGTQSRQPKSQSGSPASGGITSTDLENRLKAASTQLEKCQCRRHPIL